MSVTALDPCLFYKHNDKGFKGLQITQVDDTCGGGTNYFSILECSAARKFKSNPRTSAMPLKFNGLWIDRKEEDIVIYQTDYCDKIEEMKYSNAKSK